MRPIDADKLNYEFPTRCKDCKFKQLCDRLSNGYIDVCLGEIAKAFIDVQPTIDPVKHGQWISGCYTAPIMSETDVCSECGLRLVYGLNFKYCPNCGAKMMDEVSEDDMDKP